MREYVVQPGDSPASIAIAHAGCPKCSRDLLAVNNKPTISFPNGYKTFKDLRVGEKLNLPEKWFSPEFDALPPAYFAALPHPDGVTPSKLGHAALGVLGDYAALDVASAKVGALASLDDQPFSDAVGGTADAIDASIREVSGTGAPAVYATPYAQAAQASTAKARQRNVSLAAAIAADDKSTSFQTRLDILHDFADALASARLALTAFHGDPGPSPSPSGALPPTVIAAAQAAVSAMGADPNFCASISQPGSAINSAVHAFKTAWNVSNPGSPVPINTGTYEQATADALTRALGTAAPAVCPPRVASTPYSPSTGTLTPPQDQGLSVGAIVGLSTLGIAAVGGALYLATRESVPPPRVRRVRRVRPDPDPQRYDTIGPWKRDIS